jgi:hypothetical protein
VVVEAQAMFGAPAALEQCLGAAGRPELEAPGVVLVAICCRRSRALCSVWDRTTASFSWQSSSENGCWLADTSCGK